MNISDNDICQYLSNQYMKIRISFNKTLEVKYGSFKDVSFPIEVESISCGQLLETIENSAWNDGLIKDGYVSPPHVLVVDNEMVQQSNIADISISEKSKIKFLVMFAGG